MSFVIWPFFYLRSHFQFVVGGSMYVSSSNAKYVHHYYASHSFTARRQHVMHIIDISRVAITHDTSLDQTHHIIQRIAGKCWRGVEADDSRNHQNYVIRSLHKEIRMHRRMNEIQGCSFTDPLAWNAHSNGALHKKVTLTCQPRQPYQGPRGGILTNQRLTRVH